MNKIIIALGFLFFSTLLSAQWTAKLKTLDSTLTYLYEREMFNGTALVAENGQVLYKKAFGTANFATNEPLATTSAFNLASVSKQFFTMMVMILHEQGKLNYDDLVKKHLSEFPYEGITIRHLMTHTSGLPEYFDVVTRYMGSTDTVNNVSLLTLFKEVKPALDFKAGDKWAYCNTNYAFLASLIERISGNKMAAFFNEKLYSLWV